MFKFLLGLSTAAKITLVRFVLMALVLVFYICGVCVDQPFFTDWSKLIALILFVIAVLIDFKIKDTTTNRFLVLIGLVLILADPVWTLNYDRRHLDAIFAFQYWFAVLTIGVILAHDIIVREPVRNKFEITRIAFQYIAIVLYMFLAFNLNPWIQFIQEGIWLDLFGYICVFVMCTACVLSAWSCGEHILKKQKEKKDGQERKK